MKFQKILGVILLAGCAAISLRANASIDAALDFSPSMNPNGVWTYGWASPVSHLTALAPGYAFTPYTSSSTRYFELPTPDNGLSVWTGSNNVEPTISHNGNSVAIFDDPDNITWAPGQLSAHPGVDNQYSILRWTAPASGLFDISTAFEGLDEEGATTDIHIFLDNVSLFSSVVNRNLGTSYNVASLPILAGQNLDIAVGFGIGITTGGGGDYFNDTTAIDAQIAPHVNGGVVPEASSLVIWAVVGIGSATGWYRRRRAS